MSDLDAPFDAAVNNSKTLPERPDNETMLKLYALFKQATVGDNTTKRPGFTDPVGRAKYDAWKALAGTAQEDAQRRYIALVGDLLAGTA